MPRCFLAVELPPALKETIAVIQQRMRDRLAQELPGGLRLQWVKPDAIHLTVKFLGDIPEEHVLALKTAATASVGSLASFVLEVVGSGTFPDPRSPRVLWLGLHEKEPADRSLPRLAAAADTAAEALGYPREGRPFAPHLTLARIKAGNREVGQALARSSLLAPAERFGEVRVGCLALMKSDLRSSGAVYSKLWEIPLAPGGGERSTGVE